MRAYWSKNWRATPLPPDSRGRELCAIERRDHDRPGQHAASDTAEALHAIKIGVPTPPERECGDGVTLPAHVIQFPDEPRAIDTEPKQSAPHDGQRPAQLKTCERNSENSGRVQVQPDQIAFPSGNLFPLITGPNVILRQQNREHS